MTPDGSISRRGFLSSVGLSAAALGITPESIVNAAEPNASAPNTIATARQQLLLPDNLTYLNNGSLGPCPQSVIEASTRAWRQLERDPVGQNWGELAREAETVRQKAATFLGCNVDELAVTRNTTEAMGLVAQGIDWQPGDRVLTTNHEHGGGLAGWRYAAKRYGIEIDTVKLPLAADDPAEIIERLAAGIVPKTRVISVSHVTYTTGVRLPIRAIANLAQQHSLLLVVDGAQAPGMLDVNLSDLGCHAYATSAHKWLLAPKGTGLLYIRQDAADRIQPMMLQDGKHIYTASTGTRDLPSVIGLGAAIDFHTSLGKRAIEKHAQQLRSALVQQLQIIDNIKIRGSTQPNLSGGIVSISLPKGANSGALTRKLREQHRIVVRQLSGKPINGLRISLDLYNTKDDVHRLTQALKSELTM